MKHLFIVHSHITYLVSLRVIERLGLASESVIFGTHRNYVVNDARFKRVFPLPPNFQITRNFIKNRQNINKWYRKFNSHIGSEYIAYVPHTFNLGLALVVSQAKCKSFNYIEEGVASYNPRSFKKIKITWLRLFVNTCIYTSRALVYFLFQHRFFSLTASRLDKCYAISELSFTDSPNREMLELMPKVEKKEGLYQCVIVFDSLAIHGLIDIEAMLDLLQTVIIPHITRSGMHNIAYKLHPEHYVTAIGKKERIKIREVMHSTFKDVMELDQTFNLEIYFSQYNVSVYSYISSLGYYASLAGCVSYQLGKRLVQLNCRIDLLDEFESKLVQL